MQSQPLVVEAGTPEAAVAVARQRHGANAVLSEVQPVRSGGFLGWFARETFRVTVTPGDRPAAQAPAVVEPAADAVEEAAALLTGDTAPPVGLYSAPRAHVGAAASATQAAAGPLATALKARAATRLPAPTVPTPTAPSQAPPAAATEQPVEAPSPFVSALTRALQGDPQVQAAVQTATGTAADPAALPTHVLIAEAPAPTTPTLTIPAPAAPARELDGPGRSTGVPAGPHDVLMRLLDLGVPPALVPDGFTAQLAVKGPHAAVAALVRDGVPAAPKAPGKAGEILMVFGPGAEALTAAREIATSLRLDPAKVLWAAPDDLAGLAPARQRLTSVEACQAAVRTARNVRRVTVVAVDAPLSRDRSEWAHEIHTAFAPAAAWAVVDATRKTSDVDRWTRSLPEVAALVAHHVDDTGDPGVLLGAAHPVAMLDGAKATPQRWASLLCERIEEAA